MIQWEYGNLFLHMELSVRDAARAFSVTEPTILRWVDQEGLPSFCINGRHRFNRVDLLEWSNRHKRPMRPDAALDAHPGGKPAALIRALNAGGIHHSVAGADAASALTAAAERLPLNATDRVLVAEVLAQRGMRGATPVGDGIAIPHPRGPLVFPIEAPCVSLCFLDRPVDFGAADGKPVNALFLILTPTIREHLSLLAELAGALHDAGFKAAVARRASAEEILSLLGGES